MPSLPPPSTNATVNNATIGAVSSIPLPPPSTMTAIAAIDDCHCCCYTVNNDNPQKPTVIDCRQRQQWWSLLTEVVVDGSCGDGGLCQRSLLSMEAVMGWKDNDAMASTAMASLADRGGSNGGRHHQLCSSS